MCRFVPLEKQSKKQQRAYYQKRRGDWCGLSPVTRREEKPKAYRRCRRKREDRAAVLSRIEDRMG